LPITRSASELSCPDRNHGNDKPSVRPVYWLWQVNGTGADLSIENAGSAKPNASADPARQMTRRLRECKEAITAILRGAPPFCGGWVTSGHCMATTGRAVRGLLDEAWWVGN
jgi:hypothetical protein